MKKTLLVLAALGALAGLAAHRWAHGSKDFLVLRGALEYQYLMSAEEFEKDARSGSSQVYYFTSYYLNGLLSAYEATGDERVLKRAFRLMDAMVETGRDFREGDRAFRVWGPYSAAPDSPVPRPNLHFSFQASVPIARAAALIRSSPRLAGRHRERADRYYAFVDGSVFDYFYEYHLKRKIRWIDPDDFPLWNDNASNLGLNAAFLCRAGGKPRHCGVAREVGAAFKARLRRYRTGWIWENQTIPLGSDTDNTPGSVGNRAGVPDISHTNREAFLMQALYEQNLVFTRADLERMAATLADTIWNGDEENPSFANYLNGNDLPYRVYKKPGLNGSIYHGWALMGAYSPKAQRAMLATIWAIIKGRDNPALERNRSGFGGTLALIGHTMRNFGVVTWRPGRRPRP